MPTPDGTPTLTEYLEQVDELAIDEARDYCQTCGRHMPDGGCPACGSERVSPAPAAPFDRSEGSA